jgi:hypothetical protein
MQDGRGLLTLRLLPTPVLAGSGSTGSQLCGNASVPRGLTSQVLKTTPGTQAQFYTQSGAPQGGAARFRTGRSAGVAA